MKSPSTRSSGAAESSAKPHDQQGFSLLEVIVALAIMAIGFMTVLQLFSGSVRAVGISEQYLKAVNLGHSKLGELELYDFNIEETSGNFENEDNYRWEIEFTPFESNLNDEESGISLSQVILKVLWEDGSRQRNIELATLQMKGTSAPISDQKLSSVFGALQTTSSLEEGEETSSETGSGSAPGPGQQHLCGSQFGPGSISGNTTHNISGS